MVEIENKSEQMQNLVNKNISFIIKEFKSWHFKTYKSKARIEDITALLGITKQSLYHSLNECRKPGIEKLFRIALLFNLSLDDLCKVDLENSETWHNNCVKNFESLGKISKSKFE